MKQTLRSIGAVVFGVVVGGVLIAIVEMLGHMVYPPPPGLDLSQPDKLAALVAEIPVGALLSVLLAWFIGTFAGAWLAGRLGGRTPYIHGMIVGVFFLAAGIFNMTIIPHPTWFWFAGIAVFPVAACVASKLADRNTKAESSDL